MYIQYNILKLLKANTEGKCNDLEICSRYNVNREKQKFFGIPGYQYYIYQNGGIMGNFSSPFPMFYAYPTFYNIYVQHFNKHYFLE